MGQAAWILEKFFEWTDCDGIPENAISRDELLDNVMFYWLTDSGTSSARIYWENAQSHLTGAYDEHAVEINVPTGCSIFPEEMTPTPRIWAENRYPNIVTGTNWTRVATSPPSSSPSCSSRSCASASG